MKKQFFLHIFLPFEYFYKEKINPENIEIVGNLDIKEIQPMSLFEAGCEELSGFMVRQCLKKHKNKFIEHFLVF